MVRETMRMVVFFQNPPDDSHNFHNCTEPLSIFGVTMRMVPQTMRMVGLF